jgi:hypothetical protein
MAPAALPERLRDGLGADGLALSSYGLARSGALLPCSGHFHSVLVKCLVKSGVTV